MKSRVLFCTPIALWAFSRLPPGADTQFRARLNDAHGRAGGQRALRHSRKPKFPCEVIWYTFGRFSGRDGRDDGSESNAPLPARDVEGFRFEVADGHGEIRLLSPPSRRSGYQGVVYIRDCAGGEGRYHFRLSWIRTGGGVFPGDFRNDFPGPRRDQIAQQGDCFRNCTSCA